MKINPINNNCNQNNNLSCRKPRKNPNFGVYLCPQFEADIYNSVKGCDLKLYNKIQSKIADVNKMGGRFSAIIPSEGMIKTPFKYIYADMDLAEDIFMPIKKADNPFEFLLNVNKQDIKSYENGINIAKLEMKGE